jgi:hypothetical protein
VPIGPASSPDSHDLAIAFTKTGRNVPSSGIVAVAVDRRATALPSMSGARSREGDESEFLCRIRVAHRFITAAEQIGENEAVR